MKILLPWATEPFELHLTPLHALIGPAGVGKTHTLSRIAAEDEQGTSTVLLNLYSPTPSLSGFDHVLVERIGALHAEWDTIKHFYPWVRGFRNVGNHIEVAYQISEQVQSRDLRSFGGSLPSFLVALALPAICEHLQVKRLLLDNPSVGLHPLQVDILAQKLRAVSEQGTQVVLATHDPLLLNELKPEEVTVLTRSPQGVKATPMVDTYNFARRFLTFYLGEMWINYLGDNEKGLIEGPEPEDEAIVTEKNEAKKSE